MKFSLLPFLMISFTSWSSYADSGFVNSELNKNAPTEVPVIHIDLPDYQTMYEDILNSKDDKRELKSQLLAFYSIVLPVLRQSAFEYRIYEAEVAYTLAEPSGYDLVKLHLINSDSMSQDEYAFYERVVLNNAMSAAQNLVLQLLPQIPDSVPNYKSSQAIANNRLSPSNAEKGVRYE